MEFFTVIQKNTQKTAVALGLFDGVHVGHRAVLQQVVKTPYLPAVFTFSTDGVRPTAKQEGCNILTDDMRVERLFDCGIRQVQMPAFETFRHLSAEAFFKTVLIEHMNAAALFCGADYRFGKGAAGDVHTLCRLTEAYGVTVTVLEDVVEGGVRVSSTRIRQALKEGKMETANMLLDVPYTVTGPVIYGRQLGRTIDCPTINQAFPKEICQPRYGVYLARVYLDGEWYGGVANLGVKPTVEGQEPLLETHILGVEGDLYGKQVTVQLLSFLRPEQKFDGIATLSAAIHGDIAAAKGYFAAENGVRYEL